VTSDHGEGIDHFSTRHHGDYVYEPLVRVPFMLWTHGTSCPQSVAALSASTPSATLLRRLTLDELGVASAARAPSLEELAAQPVVIRATMQDAIIRWPHKLIVSPWFTQLFDLESDPDEKHDLSKRSRALVSDLRNLLEAETHVF
jgi:arylsulfatase A-like enzyme